jgi:hypothetical protein
VFNIALKNNDKLCDPSPPPPHGARAPVDQASSLSTFHFRTQLYTPHSVGLLWTRDRPVAETSTWQHKHSQETDIHAPVGFEPTVPASERLQTYALDRAATGIGQMLSHHKWYFLLAYDAVWCGINLPT